MEYRELKHDSLTEASIKYIRKGELKVLLELAIQGCRIAFP